MFQKRNRILFLIDDYRTSFYYSNRQLLAKDFDISFLQVVLREDKQVYPTDVLTISYKYTWSNAFNKLFNHLYSYLKVTKFIKRNNYDLVCVNVIPSVHDSFLFLYRLLLPTKNKVYLGLCTPLGNSKILKTVFRYNLKLFKYIGGDTPLLRRELHLEGRSLYRGNLGYSDKYGYKDRNFDSINLVYVGVMGPRRIETTVEGLAIFLQRNPNVKCTYDIIGGDKASIDIINETIERYALHDVVKCHGFLPLEAVQQIFDRTNVGVSFVPIINMYYGVSITKTVEYLLCGMPVIGTSLPFNSDLIDSTSGVLCDDTPDDFANALQTLNQNLNLYSSSAIRKKYDYLLTDTIITNRFVPILKEIIND